VVDVEDISVTAVDSSAVASSPSALGSLPLHPRHRDGNESLGHGSNGSPFLDGSRGSFTVSDPFTHDDEITAQKLAILKYTTYCSLTQLVLLS